METINAITMIATSVTAIISIAAFLYVSIGQHPIVEIISRSASLGEPVVANYQFTIRNRRNHIIYIRKIVFKVPYGLIAGIKEDYGNANSRSYSLMGDGTAEIECSFPIESRMSKEYDVNLVLKNALFDLNDFFPNVYWPSVNVLVHEYTPYERKFYVQYNPDLALRNPSL